MPYCRRDATLETPFCSDGGLCAISGVRSPILVLAESTRRSRSTILRNRQDRRLRAVNGAERWTDPRMMVAFVMRFARCLFWLSSYRSVSSTISSDMISSMMSERRDKCQCSPWTFDGSRYYLRV